MGQDDGKWASGIGAETQELIGGRYRLIRKIGSGGMATVWLAEDDRLDRRVAIKRLHTSAPEDAARRLAREARLGAGLSDPHLVTIYDALPAPDGVLIVMELVDGIDLDEELRSGALEPRRAVTVLEGIAQALDHVHERGVVHRDVKPSNVLLGVGDTVKLTDLGIAKALEDTGFTQSGMILGSVPYMSPEQLLGEPVGTASDIYSLGMIAYECLSGARARQETGAPQAAHRVSNDPPPDIRLERPQSSPALAAVLGAALERDPSRRPASAGAFVRDLTAALEGEARPGAHRAVAPLPSRRRDPTAVSSAARNGRSNHVAGAGPRHARSVALGGLALVAALIVLVVSQLGGGESGSIGSSAGGSNSGAKAGAGSEGSGASTTAAGSGSNDGGSTASAAAGATSKPEQAVRRFYELAAAGDTRSAWRLAASSFRSQLGGYGAFASQQSTLRQIKFRSLSSTAASGSTATVSFATTATHTDRVDRCQGSANLVSAGGGWQISELVDVTCQPR